VISVLTNVPSASLPRYLPYYIVDEILNLPRTRDWIGQVSLDSITRTYNQNAQDAIGNFPPRQKNSPASHPLVQYEGVYSHPLFAGDVTITLEEDEKKALHFHFTTFESKMEHYHFETFSFIIDMWSTKEAKLLTFITGEDGEVQGLQLEYLEKKWNFQKKGSSSFPSSKNKELKQEEEVVEDDIQMDEVGQDIFSQEESKTQFKMFKTC
jgi:hypothetical protein